MQPRIACPELTQRHPDINRLVPLFWPRHFTWSGFSGVLSDPIFRDDLLNSIVITLSTVLISIVVGFFGALAIARFRFAGRKIFIVAVLLVQMIPLTALTIPLSLLLDNAHLKNTLFGVIVAYLMFTMPFTVWTLRTFIAASAVRITSMMTRRASAYSARVRRLLSASSGRGAPA